MAEWYENALILRDFASALSDAGVVEDIVDVYKKPYRFNNEYDVWISVGQPSQEDAEWDNFIEGLNAQENGEDESGSD